MRVRDLILAAIACALGACDDSSTGTEKQSQTHWLSACQGDADCGSLSCICGVCIAACSGAGECAVPGVETKCQTASSRAAVALCGGQAPKPVCLTPCADGCAADERCESDACIPLASRVDAGRAAEPGSDAATNAGDDAGGASTGGMLDAGHPGSDAVDCLAEPSFSRACQQREDCAILVRSLNCCEDKFTGIRADQFAQANAWNTSCASQLPMCSCGGDPRRIYTDDSPQYGYGPVSVDCLDGVCRTISGGIPCGPAAVACTDTEICVAREPVASSVEYKCEPPPMGCMTTGVDLCTCGGTAGPCQPPFDTCVARGARWVDCVCSTCE